MAIRKAALGAVTSAPFPSPRPLLGRDALDDHSAALLPIERNLGLRQRHVDQAAPGVSLRILTGARRASAATAGVNRSMNSASCSWGVIVLEREPSRRSVRAARRRME